MHGQQLVDQVLRRAGQPRHVFLELVSRLVARRRGSGRLELLLLDGVDDVLDGIDHAQLCLLDLIGVVELSVGEVGLSVSDLLLSVLDRVDRFLYGLLGRNDLLRPGDTGLRLQLVFLVDVRGVLLCLGQLLLRLRDRDRGLSPVQRRRHRVFVGELLLVLRFL